MSKNDKSILFLIEYYPHFIVRGQFWQPTTTMQCNNNAEKQVNIYLLTKINNDTAVIKYKIFWNFCNALNPNLILDSDTSFSILYKY